MVVVVIFVMVVVSYGIVVGEGDVAEIVVGGGDKVN